MESIKKYLAEFIGTFVLVLFACGVAATNGLGTGYVGIALAFGLVIVAMAYSIGNVSGCHINPAVSLAMLILKKLNPVDFIGYVAAQFLGAIAGAGVLYSLSPDYFALNGLGTNGYGANSNVAISASGAFIAEILLTFVFVIAIIGVTSKTENNAVSGIVIGLSLTLVHLFGLPLTGTSVNPARSFGPAFVWSALVDNEPLKQVWVFILAPLVGAALAAFVYKFLSSTDAKTNAK